MDLKSSARNYDMATKQFSIKEILQFQPKSRRKASEGLESGTYPFFTSSQVQKKWCSDADYKKESVILGTGGGASVHYSKEFSTSTDVFILTPNTESVSARYVAYYLLGNKIILDKGFKGAGLKHISRKYVEELQIPLPINKDGDPDIKEQERIVALLEEAEKLQKKRVEADQKMEEVIPALFNELFAEQDYPKERISTIAPNKGAIRTGPFGSQLHHAEFTTEGIPVLAIDNVVTNTFRWNMPRHIPEEKYKKFKKFRVYPGDVLVTIMGTVGRVCVAPDDLPESMSTKHLCVITADKERINPIYLWAALLYDKNVRKQTRHVSKGAIMEGWNSTIIKDLLISVPPLPIQNEFVEKVKTLLEIKSKQKVSALKVNSLFASLLFKHTGN